MREKMDELSKWEKGKPLELVVMAEQLAVGAEGCFRFPKSIKTGERMEAFSSLPKAKQRITGLQDH